MRCRLTLSSRQCGSLLFLASLGILSCSRSDKLNSVQGKVMLDNEPLAGALVSFHPKDEKDLSSIPPTGVTKADGTFTVVTGQKDGAKAGVHRHHYLFGGACNWEEGDLNQRD